MPVRLSCGDSCLASVPACLSAATCAALKGRYPGSLQAAFASRYNVTILQSQNGLTAVLAIIGAMIGAPLVAREIEQRTQLAAWTQSVSRQRWYVAKAGTLAVVVAAAGLTAGGANAWLQHQLAAGDTTSSRWSWFAASSVALAGEAALAFALGTAFGAWLRRTLPAIGAALAGFAVLFPAARWAVPHLAPAASQYWTLQLILLAVLLALAAAALWSGWHATRTRAV
jgi:hypothetical protein